MTATGESYGGRLGRVRESLGWTQRDLAERLRSVMPRRGLAGLRSTISHIEAGRYEGPSPEVRDALDRVLFRALLTGVFHEVGIVTQTVFAADGGLVQVECGEVRIRFPVGRVHDLVELIGRDAVVGWER